MHRSVMVLLALIGIATVAESQPKLEADEIACLRPGSFHRLCVDVESESPLAYVRAYFQAAGSEAWYYVTLEPDAALHCSPIPSPLGETTGVRFYAEAADAAFEVGMTSEWVARVDASCESAPVPLASMADGIGVFELVTDQHAIPVGFQAAGIAPAPSAGTVTSGTPRASGGVSTPVLVGLIGGGAAAGLAVAVGGSDEGTRSESEGLTFSSSSFADGDGDGSPERLDCDDANPAVFPGGPRTVSFQVTRTMLGCERQRGVATFTNNSCDVIQVASIEIEEVTTSTGRVEMFTEPFSALIGFGEMKQFDYTSEQYCCVGGECTETEVSSLRWNVRFVTTDGARIVAEPQDWQLTLMPGCPVCP